MTTDRAAGPVVRQIERAFRERIESGELQPGHRLASRAEMAADLGVSSGTIALAVRRLRESGHVTSDTSGVYVADAGPRGAGGAERARRSVSEGKIYPEGEAARVLSAALVEAPDPVAQALDLPLNAPTIRRERVTLKTVPGSEPVPVAWSISWLGGALAAEVPELLSTDRIPGGTAGLIAERTGQTVASGTDRICARGASETEATALAIPAGLPVMAGTTTWADETGAVIEYGQWIVPPGREITHRYRTS